MARPSWLRKIARLVRSQLKPRLIFSRSVETLVREKVEVPGYFRLAVLILRTINGHTRTLVAIVERTLSEETPAQLDALLIRETGKDTHRCENHGPVRLLIPLLEFNPRAERVYGKRGLPSDLSEFIHLGHVPW
jgi:hypothetical protein